MRVIAGKARGRKLQSLAGRSVRPTSDRVKEALFSMLESRCDLGGARVLDLFAGSGALGIEALSRGAAEVVFVERDPAAARVVRRNLSVCDGTTALLPMDARRALEELERAGSRFDVVFLDPPYASDEGEKSLVVLGAGDLVAQSGLVVRESDSTVEPDERIGHLGLILTRRYGNTRISVYRRDA